MFYLKVPKMRIGALIGRNGETKESIERSTDTKLEIDSEDGSVVIDDTGSDPISAMKCRDIVQAIGRGFSPKNAFKLFNEDMFLEVIDLKDFYGKREKKVHVARARIIGTDGKVRRTIEELTGSNVSVYGNTISIIGNFDEIELAKKSVEMLLEGSKHSTVYKFLEAKNRDEKHKVDYY
ncbi:MAG: KH domain-containing protein [Thermoplasmata archaeon]